MARQTELHFQYLLAGFLRERMLRLEAFRPRRWLGWLAIRFHPSGTRTRETLLARRGDALQARLFLQRCFLLRGAYFPLRQLRYLFFYSRFPACAGLG